MLIFILNARGNKNHQNFYLLRSATETCFHFLEVAILLIGAIQSGCFSMAASAIFKRVLLSSESCAVTSTNITQFAKSQEFSNVRALQIFERKVLFPY